MAIYHHCGIAKGNKINESGTGRDTSKPQRIIDQSKTGVTSRLAAKGIGAGHISLWFQL
jgi:hypothetical protein